MTDYRHIADDVRGSIEGVDRTPDASAAALAQAYAAACNEANARLRWCDDLLRRGLRSEALHLAQQPPDLLDVVAALDVPGLHIWENLCATNDFTRPPRLLVEVAAELNEAYALEAPMQSSLEELRLLALAHAPALDRLRVTRRLRALDPSTPHWSQDVAELERACLVTIRQDAARILKADDGAAARRMVSDLTSADWITPPPADLIEPLATLAVREVVHELSEAQANDDVETGRRLMQTVKKLVHRSRRSLTPALASFVDRASAWLQASVQRDQALGVFDEICGQLTLELDRHAPVEHLRVIHDRLESLGLGVPPLLEERYQRRLALTRRSVRRAWIGTFVALLLIAGLCVGLVWWSRHRSSAGRTTTPSATTSGPVTGVVR